MKFDNMLEILRDEVGVDDDALSLVFGINGWNEKTATDILYYYTGYNDFDEFVKDEVYKS